MNIRNYTSSVPVDQSVSLIEHELVRAGATHIAKTYDPDQNLEGIVFQITANGMPLTFRLPAKWKQCQKMMLAEVRKPRAGTEERINDQALRTAWKILYDWASVQVSLIKLEQAEVIEVFLPYVYDHAKDQTLFDKLKAGGFKQLGPARETK